jgi:hypothetical protein
MESITNDVAATEGGDIELDLDPLVEPLDEVVDDKAVDDDVVEKNVQAAEEQQQVVEEQQAEAGGEIHDADKLVQICNVKVNPTSELVEYPKKAKPAQDTEVEVLGVLNQTSGPVEYPRKAKTAQAVNEAAPEIEVVAILPAGKRRGRPPGSKNDRSPAVKKAKTGLEDISWESLMSHIHARLSSMDSDECFLKAMEIAMLARHEVESRSQHLLNAFDMMSRGQSASAPPPHPHSAVMHPPVARAPVPVIPPMPSPVSTPMPGQVEMQSAAMETWMAKYYELKHYRRQHGTCEVPFSRNESLAKWTIDQKQNKTLNSTQRQLLLNIGLQLSDHPKAVKAQTQSSLHDPTKAEQEYLKQKQVKMHRTTKYRTMEPVPCVKLQSPLPPRDEGGEAVILAETPDFATLVNFPSARYFGNCVMCDESEFPVPKQNKGVCGNCDRAVWVVARTGLRIKWCKGCKNFKKWVDFGQKVSALLRLIGLDLYKVSFAWLDPALALFCRAIHPNVSTVVICKHTGMHWQRLKPIAIFLEHSLLTGKLPERT